MHAILSAQMSNPFNLALTYGRRSAMSVLPDHAFILSTINRKYFGALTSRCC